jgi:hypothetical protein
VPVQLRLKGESTTPVGFDNFYFAGGGSLSGPFNSVGSIADQSTFTGFAKVYEEGF